MPPWRSLCLKLVADARCFLLILTHEVCSRCNKRPLHTDRLFDLVAAARCDSAAAQPCLLVETLNHSRQQQSSAWWGAGIESAWPGPAAGRGTFLRPHEYSLCMSMT